MEVKGRLANNSAIVLLVKLRCKKPRWNFRGGCKRYRNSLSSQQASSAVELDISNLGLAENLQIKDLPEIDGVAYVSGEDTILVSYVGSASGRSGSGEDEDGEDAESTEASESGSSSEGDSAE